jgi:small subunit ribosomal protein S21
VPLAEIQLREGETVESTLKRFKRKVLQEDIIREIKRHAFYLKPGEKRLKSKLARKRTRKKRSHDGHRGRSTVVAVLELVRVERPGRPLRLARKALDFPMPLGVSNVRSDRAVTHSCTFNDYCLSRAGSSVTERASEPCPSEAPAGQTRLDQFRRPSAIALHSAQATESDLKIIADQQGRGMRTHLDNYVQSGVGERKAEAAKLYAVFRRVLHKLLAESYTNKVNRGRRFWARLVDQ